MPGIEGFRGQAEVGDFQGPGELAGLKQTGTFMPAGKMGMGQGQHQE
jgi:hypothetical protein